MNGAAWPSPLLIVLLLLVSPAANCGAQLVVPGTPRPATQDRDGDASDGRASIIPQIVIPRAEPIKTIELVASLPDGRPAVGAAAVVTGATNRLSANKSDVAVSNEVGRAELLCHSASFKKDLVEVTLVTSDQAFLARVPLSSAIDSILKVVLAPAWVIEGRVLVEGKPVDGAVVLIRQMTLQRRTTGGRTVIFSTLSGQANTVTDNDGWYRATVSPDKTYSVSVQTLPGYSGRVEMSYSPAPVSDGRLRVKDFAFVRGDQEIAGRVIDIDGNPISGALVAVMRQRDVEPRLWLGHDRRRQFRTDSRGGFRIRGVPAGKYQLKISGPRRAADRRSLSKLIDAEAGATDVEVTMDAGSLLDILR